MTSRQRFLSKHELADLLGVKVSYVEEKARTRAWPSCLFAELRFTEEHVEQIVAMHERKAIEKTATATSTAPAPRPRKVKAVPAAQPAAKPVTPIRATTPRRFRESA